MKKYSSILTGSVLTIHVDGVTHSVLRDSPRFPAILEAYKEGDLERAVSLIDITESLQTYSNGLVTVENRILKFNGIAMHNAIANKILDMMDQGFKVDSLVRFMENLMQNPSMTSINELYLFLERGNLPITEDGHFLAYKRVTPDFKDIHSKTINNSIGAIVEMPRNLVNDDRMQTCAEGLHVCSLTYLQSMGGKLDKTVIVKVNPRDVVSIPYDHNDTKARVCRYEVIEEYTGELDQPAWDMAVVESASDTSEDDEVDSWGEDDICHTFDEVDINSDDAVLDGGKFGNSVHVVDVHETSAKPDHPDFLHTNQINLDNITLPNMTMAKAQVIAQKGLHVPPEVLHGAELASQSLLNDLEKLQKKSSQEEDLNEASEGDSWEEGVDSW